MKEPERIQVKAEHWQDRLQHPPHVEADSWADWIGSRQCQQLDEPTQALIHAAFAAGFEAGWRQRGASQP